MAMNPGHESEYKQWQPEMTKIISGKPVRFRDVCVLEITIGDVEDPDIYVGQHIWEWQRTAEGEFVMENAVEKPYWTRHMDYASYGHKYRIMARLGEQHETFWTLKWGPHKK
jgi:hypothetical protein